MNIGIGDEELHIVKFDEMVFVEHNHVGIRTNHAFLPLDLSSFRRGSFEYLQKTLKPGDKIVYTADNTGVKKVFFPLYGEESSMTRTEE